MTIHTIPLEDLPTIRKRVEKVNRRADKLGVEGMSLNVGEVTEQSYTDDLGFRHTYRTVDVEVIGPVVKFEGWTFAATIDHREGLVYSAPDVEGDFRAYADEARCEHCERARDRNRTFVLRHDDGTQKQVGSTCLKDFLGHDVSIHVKQMEGMADLDDFLGGFGSQRPQEWGLVEFLAVTEKVIRVHGWVSRSRATEFSTATADEVLIFLNPMTHQDVRAEIIGGSRHNPASIEDDCYDEAKAAIEWFASTTSRSDYEYNLAKIVSNGYVTYKSAGLAASLMSAYRRERQKQIESEREQAERTPVPDTDERMTIEGVITKIDYKDTEWGARTVITVQDDRGFLVWGTKPKALGRVSVGSKVRFTARIERSREDATFGFFNRPTQAEVVELADTEVA